MRAIDNNLSYWFQVLKHFERKGYIYNGLTIPFLIGSAVHVKPKQELLTLKEWMEEIKRATNTFTIMRCAKIGEYVIGILDNESKSHLSHYKMCSKLIITDNSFEGIKCAELENHFEELYSNKLNHNNYSKNNGLWGDFTRTEKSRIEEVYIF